MDVRDDGAASLAAGRWRRRSMFARQAGAGRVFACEVSRTAVQLAREALTANGFAGDISLLHAASHDLVIPRDLPERVSLVVTETMDAALFGEGIVGSLVHAWRHLLLPPRPTTRGNGASDAAAGCASSWGRVIPAGATVYACAVECPEIRRYHRLCVREVCGIRLDTGITFRSFVSQPSIIERDIPTTDDEQDEEEGGDDEGGCQEPYTTERMSRIPGGFHTLCDPFPILTVNFNDPQELEGLFSRAPEQRGVRATRSGALDALVAWFHLHLDDEATLSTAPGEDSCWEQAVYPLVSAHGHDGCMVVENDMLTIEAVCREGHLVLSCISVTPASRPPADSASPTAAVINRTLVDRSDAQAATIMAPVEVATLPGDGEVWLCSAIGNLSVTACALAPWEVARLNDVEHWKAFSQAARDAAVESGRAGPPCILDLSTGLSVLPIMLAHVFGSATGGAIVCSSAEDPWRRRALRSLAAANGVAAQLRFLDNADSARGRGRADVCGDTSVAARGSPDDRTVTMGEEKQQHEDVMESAQDHTEDNAEDRLWDVIVLEAVEPTGLLRQGLIEKATLARSLLRPGGTVLPLRATLVGQLLESDAVLRDAVVLGSQPTLGLRIAPFLNLFSVPMQVNLDLCTLPGRRLSRPFEVFTLKLTEGSEASTEHRVTAVAEEAGRVMAVALWVELRLTDGGGGALSTLRARSHVKQAAVALEETLCVGVGSHVEVHAQHHDGDVSLACRVVHAT